MDRIRRPVQEHRDDIDPRHERGPVRQSGGRTPSGEGSSMPEMPGRSHPQPGKNSPEIRHDPNASKRTPELKPPVGRTKGIDVPEVEPTDSAPGLNRPEVERTPALRGKQAASRAGKTGAVDGPDGSAHEDVSTSGLTARSADSNPQPGVLTPETALQAADSNPQPGVLTPETALQAADSNPQPGVLTPETAR